MEKPKIRVGLLLQSKTVKAWHYRLIEEINKSEYAEIILLVFNDSKNTTTTSSKIWKYRNRLLYYAYSSLDQKIFKPFPNASAGGKGLDSLLTEDIKQIGVVPIQKKFTDWFEDHDIAKIEKENVDVFIRLGFRILKGKILDIPKYGIWSVHHADNDTNRGAPPGFWECVESKPVTGTILQIINKELDGGIVLQKSWSCTERLSPTLNNNRNLWKTLFFFPRKLEELYKLGGEAFMEKMKTNSENDFSIYAHHLYKAPGNFKMVPILFSQGMKIVKRSLEKIFYNEQWIILYRFQKDRAKFSLRRFKKIFPPSDRIYADPFVVKHEGEHFVFFEEMKKKEGRGWISVLNISKEKGASQPITVLDEKYHLSYPFIFKENGKYYMIPESFHNKTLDLLECVEFPQKWKKVKTLMEGVSAADSTLYKKGDIWWLFTSIAPCDGAPHDDELFLFYSKDIFNEPFIAHPQNPIVSDVRLARCGGGIFESKGKIYRPSQDSSHHYGYALNINEILELTPTTYKEKAVKKLLPSWEKEVKGIHTLNANEDVIVADAIYKRRRFF